MAIDDINKQAASGNQGEIQYMSPIEISEKVTKRFCRFKKYGIKYVDYKDPDFLMQFVNEQGKIIPRRITGTSLKYQRRVAQAIKRARHLAIMPYMGDQLK